MLARRSSAVRSPGPARRSLPDRLQIERDGPLADLTSRGESVLARAAEVDARVDSGIRAFPRRLGEARERSSDTLERLPARSREGSLVAQDTREDHRGGRTEHALRRRIVRDRRSVLEAVPVRVAGGRIVPVVVALADRRD